MKKTAVFAVILLFIAGIAYAKEFKVKRDEGKYDVEAKIDNNPPIVGNNNISIEIKDKSGKHITDAKVVVEYSMPAMPGMPAMHYKEAATVSGNTYKAVMNLSMAGSWNIEVKIKKDEKTGKDSKNRTVKFNVDAH
jgi:hypothetical protein